MRPGDHGTVFGPAGARVDFTILEVDPDERRWRWRLDLEVAKLTLDHGVDPVGWGSAAWVRIRAPRLLVAPYAPLAWLALRRLTAT